MNPEIKAKWVAALRSGQFKQGKHVLHNTDDNSFCCLGVLCEINGLKKSPTTAVINSETGEKVNCSSYEYESVEYQFATTNERVLPRAALVKLGLEDHEKFQNPNIAEYEKSLAELNDSGHSFEQIADIIEKYL